MADLIADLAGALGEPNVLVSEHDQAPFLTDWLGKYRGAARAVIRPSSTEEVAAAMRICARHGAPVVPQGGNTSMSGGATPDESGKAVVLSLARLNRIRAIDSVGNTITVDAGIVLAKVQQAAEKAGRFFPLSLGAEGSCTIGGNLAANAGGVAVLRYGTMRELTLGLEVVLADGRVWDGLTALRKDNTGYALRDLFIGSEGTLGIITAAWLRLIPAPEASQAMVAFYPDAVSGCAAIDELLGTGLDLAAIEFVDEEALDATPAAFAPEVTRAFAILVEAEGAAAVVEETLASASEVLAGAEFVYAPDTSSGQAAIWRWREGMTSGVTAQLGGKVSEDVVVPLGRLAEAIAGTREIGARHGLRACSWGHAGDGNLHSTFMVRRGDQSDLAAADRAAVDLFDLAIALGGSVSGEHGIGSQKLGQLERYWEPRAYELHTQLKGVFDPLGLLNPGKKL